MGYIYLDSQFDEHPKVVAAGPQAAWLYVRGLLYCHRNNTPGTIPKGVVPSLNPSRKWRECVVNLLQVGLWTEHIQHYEVHDYMQWNARSFAARDRAKKAAHARWHPGNGDAPSIAQAHAQAMPAAYASSNADAMPTQPKNQRTKDPLSPVDNSRRELTAAEEDLIHQEATRRMRNLPQPPNHPTAWLEVAKANLRRERLAGMNIQTQPRDPPTAQRRDYDHPRPECKTCNSTGWIEIYNPQPGPTRYTPCQACA